MVCHDDDLALRKSAVELLTIHLSGFSLHICIVTMIEEKKIRDNGEERKGKGIL